MTQPLAFEVHMSSSYDEALEQVATALKAEGFGILTRIDVRTTLKEKLGQEFRPFSILGACNPPLAHRALAHNALTGLLLPCNVTVEADPAGGTLVRVGDPETLLSTGGLGSDPVLKGVAAEARTKLQRVVKSLNELGRRAS
jgi:uncharacterized protein (DUF302 family)